MHENCNTFQSADTGNWLDPRATNPYSAGFLLSSLGSINDGYISF